MSDLTVGIKLLAPWCKPERQHADDSCYDLCAHAYTFVRPGELAKVPLGLCLEVPPGWEAQLRPRSGLSAKGIWVAFGTIDAGYRGEIMATLLNTTQEGFQVQRAMRVAQLTFARVPQVTWMTVTALTDSERGENGFGSTGLNSGTDS